MAGQDLPHDPAKALEYKEAGNESFKRGAYAEAEALYTKAINHDPSNSLFFTNRAAAVLKLSHPLSSTHCRQVISDCETAIRLHPDNMKAYYQLAQAQIELHQEAAALESSLTAHRLCVVECQKSPPGKGSSSIEHITTLVLRCKREWWEMREEKRLRERGGLLQESIEALRLKRNMEIAAWCESGLSKEQGGEATERDCKSIEATYEEKIEELRRTFEQSGLMAEQAKKRKVPDWCIDDITFGVMLDPVVTKTGQSYDRSSLMEHLRRSPTDPLTREPLRVEDLRPNLALKEACAEFLEQNGWAVDW